MTIKQILAPVSGETNADHVFSAAFALGALFGAHVMGTDTVPTLDAYIEAGLDVYAARQADVVESLRATQSRKRKAVADMFAKARTRFGAGQTAATRNVSAEWISGDAHRGATIPLFGPFADLIVINRPGSDVASADSRIFQTAVYGVHRPVVIVPVGAPPISRRGAIAWSGDVESAAAVRGAIDVLSTLDQVDVFQLTGLSTASTPTSSLVALLQRWNIGHQLHTFPPGADNGLRMLDAAQAVGGTVLVLGASPHGPLREVVLSPTTQQILDHSDITLIMAHR